MALLTLVHATAVSVLGKAFSDATSAGDKQLLRTMANAFVTYDVAVEGVAAALISIGAVTLAYYLWRIGVVSTIAALVLAGDGAIWGTQYYRLLRVIHFSFPEWVPYVSLGLFLCATAIILQLNNRERVPVADPAPEPA